MNTDTRKNYLTNHKTKITIMNNIVTAIAERIRDEHRKHPDIDWEYIAASKIYQSFIDKCDEVPVKEENASRDVITEDDVVKGLLRYHDKLYGGNTDTLFDTTNKNEDTVSNIIHNSDSEPSVNDKIIIDTEVYYECIKGNNLFEKGCKMGFSYCDDDVLKCTLHDGFTMYITEAIVKEMIANRELDTPF